MDGRTKGCLAAVAITVVGGTLLCGCSGIFAVLWGPEMVLSTILDDEEAPFEVTLDTSSSAEQIAERIGADLARTKTTSVTGPQLNTIAKDAIGKEEGKVAFTFDDTHGLMEFSANIGENGEQKWVNGALGGTFTIKGGWFTEASVDDVRLGSWDFGSQLAGEPMAQQINSSLAEERGKEPDLDAVLNAIERMTVENSTLVLTTNDQWEAALDALD